MENNVVHIDFGGTVDPTDTQAVEVDSAYTEAVRTTVIGDLEQSGDCSAAADAHEYAMFAKMFSRHLTQD